MRSYLLTLALVVVILMSMGSGGGGAAAAAAPELPAFFDTVVNISAYPNRNASLFLGNLSRLINASVNTMVVISNLTLTATQASNVNQFCMNSANLTRYYTDLRRLNVTFVGNVTNATAASNRLRGAAVVKLCALGVYSMTPMNATFVNKTYWMRVTLKAGVTPAQFIGQLATYLQITPSVFVAANFTGSNITSYQVATSFNLTCVGANPIAVQTVVLGLTYAQLYILGATDVSTSTVGGGGDGGNNDTTVIVVCCVIGGLLIIGAVVYFMKKKSGSNDNEGNKENTLSYPNKSGHEMNQENHQWHGHRDEGGFHSQGNNNAQMHYQQTSQQQQFQQQQHQVYPNDANNAADFL